LSYHLVTVVGRTARGRGRREVPVAAQEKGIIGSELPHGEDEPLRGIARIHAAATALAIAAITGLLWLGRSGPQGPVVNAVILAVVFVASGGALMATLRLVRRELGERQRVERVLHDSESALQQVAQESLPVLDLFDWPVFYVCEWPTGTMIFLSPAAPRLWGRPPGVALFDSRPQWNAAIHPDDCERVARTWETGAALGDFDVEYRITRGDGEERWIYDRAVPMRNEQGGVARIVGVAQDVTERTRGELRSRDLLESAPDASVIVDAAGRIVMVNAQTEKLFGYSRAELASAPVEMLLPERYRARHRELRDAFVAAPAQRPMGAGVDLYARHKQGFEIPVEISLSPLATDGGIVVSASIRDVTEARAAQRELARQRDALESANQDLARSNAELEQFASVASHDLQEPLRKLVSFSELLEQDAGDQLPERARQDLAFITDAARRMRTLVRDLLALSRTGTSEMKVIPVSLDACADRALEALDLRISESAAVITRDPLPIVMGDLTLLEALYQNLLSNALKFTAPGQPPRIHLTAERGRDSSWVLGVRDAGIGIDPKHAAEIFRPFRRLHAPEKYPGTGIGLAIASKAIDRHGGRLWVEPAGPKGEPGSHFRFTLERAAGEEAA
jgi:PAS domain S-box-containing protein